MKLRSWAPLAAIVLAGHAQAGSLSYVGRLDPSNPNDVFLASFTLAGVSAVTIQTWGYGGTSDAPGGTNAAGQPIFAGGFDPYLSLFSGGGSGATFLGSDDDGLCPPGHAARACADSTLSFGALAAGTYTVALTLPFNYSYAESYGAGTLGDGFIGLDASYDDGACTVTCSSAYAFDIVSVPAVPEPSAWALLGAGSLLLPAVRRLRSRPAHGAGRSLS